MFNFSLKINVIVVFLVLLWIIVAVVLFLLLRPDSKKQDNELSDSYTKKSEVKKYYNSVFVKIDDQLSKAELIADLEGKLIHYSKVFDNLLKVICDFLWNTSEVLENNDLDKNNFNYIECISEHSIFKEETIDNLHRARKNFNMIKHDLDCKDVDESFLISTVNDLYDFVKRIIFEER